jgi:HEXXH motif-containing protein
MLLAYKCRTGHHHQGVVVHEVPQAALSSVQLTMPMFDSLASGDLEASSVGLLLNAERGRRLVLLQHVLSACRADPALLQPLEGVGAAEELLLAVEENDAATMESLLLDPLTGMWLATAVRIVEGAAADPSRPHWVHLGGLAALAASAALRARMTFVLQLPAERGGVLLPGVGRVDLPAPPLDPHPLHQVVTVRSDGERVLITDAHHQVELPLPLHRPSPRWTPAPLVRCHGSNGHDMQVRVEHLDPAPRQVGLPRAAQLSALELTDWQARLVEAWAMIDVDHPQEAYTLAAGLSAIIPLSSPGPLAGSSAEGFGAAAIQLPVTTVDLASALIHEFRHSVLNGLLHLVRLYRPQPYGALYYAPWRDDPRPLSGMLHGAYAFSAVTGFWCERSGIEAGDGARRAQLEFAVSRRNTAAVLDILSAGDASAALTPLGARMVTLLSERVAGWTGEEVEPEAARLAGIVADTHRAAWRAHHVRTAPGWAAHAADAWRGGQPAPSGAGGTVMTDPGAHGLNHAFVLARWAYARSHGPVDSALGEARARDRTGADQLLVDGDGAGAALRYLAQIAADPDDPRPWGGLGPALAAAATPEPTTAALTPSTQLLLEHPERVRALHSRLRAGPGPAPDVIELAHWLVDAP